VVRCAPRLPDVERFWILDFGFWIGTGGRLAARKDEAGQRKGEGAKTRSGSRGGAEEDFGFWIGRRGLFEGEFQR
jgi:hypothetical protein